MALMNGFILQFINEFVLLQLKRKRKALGDITNHVDQSSDDEHDTDQDVNDSTSIYSPSDDEDNDDDVPIPDSPEALPDPITWSQHLPPELASDERWMGFFSQQIKNCRTYKRWSVR